MWTVFVARIIWQTWTVINLLRWSSVPKFSIITSETCLNRQWRSKVCQKENFLKISLLIFSLRIIRSPKQSKCLQSCKLSQRSFITSGGSKDQDFTTKSEINFNSLITSTYFPNNLFMFSNTIFPTCTWPQK
jgi:hypothetical protein